LVNVLHKFLKNASPTKNKSRGVLLQKMRTRMRELRLQRSELEMTGMKNMAVTEGGNGEEKRILLLQQKLVLAS
jgi:hypothetical protein